MNRYFSWELLREVYPVLVRGAFVSIELLVSCFATAVILGLLIALLRRLDNKAIKVFCIMYIELCRNSPVLIVLIWFFYAFPMLLGVQLSAFMAAYIGLSLNSSAYCAEIFRGGIDSVDHGQWEGGRALGMKAKDIMRRIILPQVVRRMVPAFTNRAIELGKETSLASVIAVHDLMYQGRLLSATYYRPFEFFTVIAIIYFVIIYPVSLLSSKLEQKND
ncbi:MAG: amino acid ABC transporter permease [Acidihalobacter sp.]|jgi:polar amino acid transport system permease protein